MKSVRKGCRAGTVYLRRSRFNQGWDEEADLDVEADLKVRLYQPAPRVKGLYGQEPFEERSIAFLRDPQVFG